MTIRALAIGLLLVVSVSSSCQRLQRMTSTKEKKIDIVTQEFSKDGVSFQFPNDWSLSKDVFDGNRVREIQLKDAHYTHFKIAVPPSGSYMDLGDNVEAYKDNFRKNMKAGNATDFETTIVKRERGGAWIEGKRLKFANDLAPNDFQIGELFIIERGKSNAFITISYPETDFVAADREIQLIFNSLKFDLP